MTRTVSTVTHASMPPLEPYPEVTRNDTAIAFTAVNRVIAANRDFYSQVAGKYDRYESCAFDGHLQDILEKDLDTIHSWFTSLARRPHCLDCGGGTGNLALKMLARGWNVTVVDVSTEMLALLREKARVKGYSPWLVNSSIERFLEETREAYDLVAFSSVLHHLYSYASVVRRAAARVCPGGVFYSNYDPAVPKSLFWTRVLDTLDISLAKTMFDPSDVLPAIGRRFLKVFEHRDPQFRRKLVSAGDLAEYRARTGVNDRQVLRLLRNTGFSIVEHLRYPTGRTKAVRFLNEKFRFLENFKIIAWRDSGFCPDGENFATQHSGSGRKQISCVKQKHREQRVLHQ
jgi:2-polyprenyl-3-methyl-5-hydroxy-6-metoxy-1,4-benzoquinol methylase